MHQTINSINSFTCLLLIPHLPSVNPALVLTQWTRDAFKKCDLLSLTPSFSWVNEGRGASPTVSIQRFLLMFGAVESLLELTLAF